MTETLSQQWSDEGVYPVSEGVYRVPLPLPMDALTAVNVYIGSGSGTRYTPSDTG